MLHYLVISQQLFAFTILTALTYCSHLNLFDVYELNTFEQVCAFLGIFQPMKSEKENFHIMPSSSTNRLILVHKDVYQDFLICSLPVAF